MYPIPLDQDLENCDKDKNDQKDEPNEKKKKKRFPCFSMARKKKEPQGPVRFGWIKGVMVSISFKLSSISEQCFYTMWHILQSKYNHYLMLFLFYILSTDPMYVKYLGSHLILEVTMDHSPGWNRYG